MNVVQEWVSNLPLMQQTVLLCALRGPDGSMKNAGCKYLLRWYRRCILKSAMDGSIFLDPYTEGGGSFMGPIPNSMDWALTEYFNSIDSLPHHYQMHFLHAIEILGYKHPHSIISKRWFYIYNKYVQKMHLNIETVEQLDYRLRDNEEQWASCQIPPDGD